jgi:hypothetical protein
MVGCLLRLPRLFPLGLRVFSSKEEEESSLAMRVFLVIMMMERVTRLWQKLVVVVGALLVLRSTKKKKKKKKKKRVAVPGVIVGRTTAAVALLECGESSMGVSTYGCASLVPYFTRRECSALIALLYIMIPVC